MDDGSQGDLTLFSHYLYASMAVLRAKLSLRASRRFESLLLHVLACPYCTPEEFLKHKPLLAAYLPSPARGTL